VSAADAPKSPTSEETVETDDVLRLAEEIAEGESKSRTGHAQKRVRGLGTKTIALRDAVLKVFASFDGSMSTRQLFYQLVSRGAVSNTPAAYGTVQRVLVDMRRDGSVPYSRVVDRTRSKHQRPGWDGVDDIMAGVAEQYRRDLWSSQSTHVHVCCEKQALEGVFGEIVDEYGAPLWTLRGFVSEAYVWEWSEEIKALTEDGVDVVVAYFGDHDPSGLCLEEDCHRRLREQGAEFTWHRAGLLWDDFERFNLVNVVVKWTDSRAKKYAERFGNRAAELDALPPDQLERRIREVIAEHVDREAWDELRRAEQVERASLKIVAAHWDAAVKGAKGAA
jgi:hypothetical protein